MSVLIKNINIPKCCSDCPLNYDQMSCIITGTGWWSDRMILMDFDCDKERLYNCPLVEISTPHGRLIDIRSVEDGKFTTNVNEYQRWWNGALESIIDYAPTVIEAERNEE